MKIDHLGIAVESISSALEFYQDALGLQCTSEEIVEDQGVKIALLPMGESRIELLEALDENSTIAKFLSKHGPGLHHICLRVEDINTALEKLKSQSVRLVDEVPRMGADDCLVAFVHPKSTNGVLIELSQKIK